MTLSKTDYKNYLACPEEFWLSRHKRDLFPPLTEDALFMFQQGNLVDKFVRELFADKTFLSDFKLKNLRIEFQKRAETREKTYEFRENTEKILNLSPNTEGVKCGFVAIADVAVFNDDEGWCDLFEVKATKAVKDDHVYDLAFQQFVFERAGVKIRKTWLVHINPTYVYDGIKNDAYQYFRIPNISDKVHKLREFTEKTALEALDFLHGAEPKAHFKICSNKLDCVFLKHHFPHLPDYSVLDIARLGEKKRTELIYKNIIDIKDVPSDFPLSTKQRLQVNVAQSKQIIIHKKAIQAMISKWKPPFYFLDYETIGLVFPLEKGLAPYQQMVFQYSLHVIYPEKTPENRLEIAENMPSFDEKSHFTEGVISHKEFIISSKTETTHAVLTQLQRDLPEDEGTIFVWNESFEKTRNKEMAHLYPEFSAFLRDVNSRIYDLETPFKTQDYIHPDFKGRSSIKKVLPVLVPALNYKNLNIQNGSMAFTTWKKMIFDNISVEEQAQLKSDLLAYCQLDTWAMVKIWEHLKMVGTDTVA